MVSSVWMVTGRQRWAGLTGHCTTVESVSRALLVFFKLFIFSSSFDKSRTIIWSLSQNPIKPWWGYAKYFKPQKGRITTHARHPVWAVHYTACGLNMFNTWTQHMGNMRQIMLRQVGSYLKFSMCLHPGLTLKPVGLLVGINKGGSGTTSFQLTPPLPQFQTFELLFCFFLHMILLRLLL